MSIYRIWILINLLKRHLLWDLWKSPLISAFQWYLACNRNHRLNYFFKNFIKIKLIIRIKIAKTWRLNFYWWQVLDFGDWFYCGDSGSFKNVTNVMVLSPTSLKPTWQVRLQLMTCKIFTRKYGQKFEPKMMCLQGQCLFRDKTFPAKLWTIRDHFSDQFAKWSTKVTK